MCARKETRQHHSLRFGLVHYWHFHRFRRYRHHHLHYNYPSCLYHHLFRPIPHFHHTRDRYCISVGHSSAEDKHLRLGPTLKATLFSIKEVIRNVTNCSTNYAVNMRFLIFKGLGFNISFGLNLTCYRIRQHC